MKRVVLIYTVSILIFGCSTLPPVKNPQITEGNLPPKYYIEGIKTIKQNYLGCVPACLEMVFDFYGRQLDKEVIAKWIQRAKGTTDTDLEQFVRMQGFSVYPFYDWSSNKRKIKYFLSQGYLILVGGQIRHETELHMIVLIGYDDAKIVKPGVGWYSLTGEQAKGAFNASDPGYGKIIEISYKRFNEFHSTTLQRYSYYGLVIYPKNISSNIKGKQPLPQDMKLPTREADIAPKPQPPLTEKPKTLIPVTPVTPSPVINTITVTGTFANIRSGAGNEFSIVITVKQGNKLILLGEHGEWFHVRLENGGEGWINSRFVK